MEIEFVEWLEREFKTHPNLELGIGDDAAILNWDLNADKKLVVTKDTLIDLCHFDSKTASLKQIGYKSLAVNLSDLAGMAAEPHSIVVSFVWPIDWPLEDCKQIYVGMKPLLDKHSIAIAGGDTNIANGPLVVSITAIGIANSNSTFRRAGMKTSDVIAVTGPLGGSILGSHLDFTPRIAEAIYLAENYQINAAMDISDGLLLDLLRMCEQSGCGSELDYSAVPNFRRGAQVFRDDRDRRDSTRRFGWRGL